MKIRVIIIIIIIIIDDSMVIFWINNWEGFLVIVLFFGLKWENKNYFLDIEKVWYFGGFFFFRFY